MESVLGDCINSFNTAKIFPVLISRLFGFKYMAVDLFQI